MYITKTIPDTSRDGKIKDGIEVKNGILYLGERLKFEEKKWYQLGDDDKWYFLGIGANPAYETEKEGVIDETLFDAIFTEEEGGTI